MASLQWWCMIQSPATELFVLQLVPADNQRTSKTLITDPLWGASTGYQRFPSKGVSKAGTGKFPAQMATNAENVSIWWRHHALNICVTRIHWVSRTLQFHNEALTVWFYNNVWPFYIGYWNKMHLSSPYVWNQILGYATVALWETNIW